MEQNYPHEKGLMPRYDERYRYPWLRRIDWLSIAEKIIFLNKKNLTSLEGYKATAELKYGLGKKYEIHLILTGFSEKAAQELFKKLEAMKDNEIVGE